MDTTEAFIVGVLVGMAATLGILFVSDAVGYQGLSLPTSQPEPEGPKPPPEPDPPGGREPVSNGTTIVEPIEMPLPNDTTIVEPIETPTNSTQGVT